MKIKKNSTQFVLILFAIVCVEAFIILVLLNQGAAGILGGDAWFYDQATINLLQTGSFSILNENNVLEPTMGKPPGYSIFLAGIYFLSGNSILAVRLVQFFLFWLIAVGIYRLTNHFIDEKTAKVSSLLSVTYLPVLFFTIYHLSEVLATFLVTWIVCKTLEWRETGKISDVVLTGGLFSFLSLVRPNWALFAAPIILVIYLSKGIKSLPNLGIFVLICTLLISPWLIRNYLLTGQIILSSVAKQTAYLSVLQYNGKISYSFTFEEYNNFVNDFKKRWNEINRQSESSPIPKTMIEKELILEDGYQVDLNNERQSLSIGKIITSIPKRVGYLWSTQDSSPSELYNSFYHRIAQAHFLLITFLILLGIYLRRKSLGKEWFLLAPAIYITIIHLIFLMETRYSIPARPLLLIYAGAALVWIIEKGKYLLGEKE